MGLVACYYTRSLLTLVPSAPPIYALFEMDNLKPTTKSEVVIDIISEDKTTFTLQQCYFMGHLFGAIFKTLLLIFLVFGDFHGQ